ncbi:hypothetical protein CFC21_026833 [Triticum aestivum]|uniref:rRNA N-glycosidase n=2 Tax=Triticum aestivum TaxID=4565 RepID=A0A3B6CHD8_WHEAT|nr:hypothetical protein CFC21_026833 [Triticum aestivum]
MAQSSDAGDEDELKYVVHVGGSDVSEAVLKKHLEKFGEGVRVTMHDRNGKSKKFAYVYCENKDVASQVIELLNEIYPEGNKIKATISNQHKENSRKEEEEVDLKTSKPVEKAREDVIIPYTIGDKEGHIKFITELRKKLSKLKEGSDVVDEIFEGDSCRVQAQAHPLLVAKPSAKKAVRWIHVELRAIDEKDNTGSTVMLTTLAVRKDNLYVKGFTNEDGQWFELPANAANDNMKLPEGYKAKELKVWDVSYRGLMNLSNKDQVKKTLMSTRLCKAFAVRAVSRLSRYRIGNENDLPEKKIDENLTRLSLAGLMVMICEAARMNPFLDTIVGGWDGGTGLTSRLLDIMWDWGSMSAALLKWKKTGKWPIKCRHGLGTALASINLVLDSTDVTGSGPTWVEIFAISSNFPVISITVIDEGKRKNTIYYKQKTEQIHEGQTQQGIVPLKLTDKGRRISGYEYFGMEVVLPPWESSGDSITKKFKWDCRKQDVDTTEVVAHTINLDHGRKIVVTYLVMNNLVEAKVEVKLPLIGESPKYWRPNDLAHRGTDKIRGKKYTVHGEIIAQIDGFEDNPIVLFRTEGEQEFPRDLETSILMQSSVSVPSGKRLHIDMAALDIKEAPGDRPVKKASRLSYDCGRSRRTSLAQDQGDANIEVEVEVNVTWPAQEETVEREPDVVFIIGDREKFTSSIEELRGVLMRHEHPEDALHGCKDKVLLDTGKHPVLARRRHSQQPPRWIHVKLEVVAGEETSSTTLAIRDDECCAAGFMNQNGVWYDLAPHYPWRRSGDKQLPPEYNSVRLDWDYRLWSDVAQYELIHERLGRICLGQESARAAVRMMSRYPDVEEHEEPMLALAQLIIMVCESARFNPISESIATGWDTRIECPKELYEYTRIWRQISVALLRWKDHGHNSNRWPQQQHSEMGINCPVDALRIVYLLFNSDDRTKQIYMQYTIKEKAGFSTFIEQLRDVLARHDHQEGILDGHPNRKSDSDLNNRALLHECPARLIHIKLQLVGEETSTTLAVRDNDVHLLGFMNHEGVWYEAWDRFKGDRLGAEFNPKSLMWGSYKHMLPRLNVGLLRFLSLSNDDGDVSRPKLHLSDWDKVRKKLGTERLGKDFAVEAVRMLSRYPVVEKGECPRLALAGLIIMFCESARLDPVHEHIANVWEDDNGTGFPKEVMEQVQGLDMISDTLLIWKDTGYHRWPQDNDNRASIREICVRDWLHGIGIRTPKDALDVVHLVPACMMEWDDEPCPWP